MASSSSAGRVYEDFEPPSDLVSDPVCDTYLIYLPGFRKDQLKVQLTSSRILKISGERLLGGNKWRRFHKEFPIQPNFDTRQISAKFEGGILYIRLPKLITPAAPEAQQLPQDKGKAALEPPKPQLPQPLPPTPTQPQPEPEPEPKRVLAPPKLAEGEAKKKEGAMAMKDEIPQTPSASAQSKPQKEAPPKDMPKLEEEEKGERKEVEEKKGGSEPIKRSPGQVFRGSGLFRELRKPESMKRLVISVIMVLAIGFYISYIFKSFARDEQQKVVEYDQIEL